MNNIKYYYIQELKKKYKPIVALKRKTGIVTLDSLNMLNCGMHLDKFTGRISPFLFFPFVLLSQGSTHDFASYQRIT